MFNASNIFNEKSREKISFCLWNVNGLTAEKLLSIQSLITKFDFVALLQTWLKEKHCYDLSLKGYNLQCFYRTALSRKANRGSGGIAVYIKEHLVKGMEKVHNAQLNTVEDRVWFRLHKYFFGLDKDLYLGVWYIPPLYSCRHLQSEEMWAAFERETSYFQINGDIVVMGDLNARTGEKPDWIEMDEMKGVPLPDVYVVDDDIKPRVSMDKTVNTCGERLIDICVATGLKIVNGRFGKDEGTGRLTCHTYSGGSVIDYVLTESAYFTHLCNFEVWDPLLVSDHCPIQLELFYRSHGVPICAPQHSRHDENPRYFKLDVTQMDHSLEVITRDQVQGLEASIDGLNVTESAKILEAHIKELGFASGVLIHCKKREFEETS